MKYIRFFCMALIIIAACKAFAIEETIEPTLKYVISINGKEYDLELENMISPIFISGRRMGLIIQNCSSDTIQTKE